jgi:hypothetical protein
MRVLLLIVSVSLAGGFSIQLPRQLVRAVSSVFIATSLVVPTCTGTAAAAEWQLLNGDVQLPDLIQLQTTSKRSLILSDPVVVGAGGGGAVFAFRDSSTLLKVSWKGSTKSVQRECRTLQMLQEANVQSAERCLGEFEYYNDKEDGRVMIAVEPYVRDAVASLEEVDTAKQADAVEQIARTLVQMLAANIITIDVQPLINSETGEVIFIDMTEAQKLHPPYTFLDQTLMGSFTTEMLALIPERHVETATKTMLQEIQALESKGTRLSDEAKEVLFSQTLFFPDE